MSLTGGKKSSKKMSKKGSRKGGVSGGLSGGKRRRASKKGSKKSSKKGKGGLNPALKLWQEFLGTTMKKLNVNRPEAMSKAKVALDKAKKDMPNSTYAEQLKEAEKHL